MVSPIEDARAKILDEKTGDESSNGNQVNEHIDGKDKPANVQATVCCKTCASTQECEEDQDNPGDYYCRCCWEEYAVLSQQQQGHDGSGKVCEDSTSPHQMATQQSDYQASTQPQTQALTPMNREESSSQRTGTEPDEDLGEKTETVLMTEESFAQLQNDDLGGNDSSQLNSTESNAKVGIPDSNEERKNAFSWHDNNELQLEADGLPKEGDETHPENDELQEGGNELNRANSSDTKKVDDGSKAAREKHDELDTDGGGGVDPADSHSSKVVDDKMAIDNAPIDDNMATDQNTSIDNAIEHERNEMSPLDNITKIDNVKKDNEDGNAVNQSVEDSNTRGHDNANLNPADKLSNNEEENASAAAQENAVFECDDDDKHDEDDDQDLDFGTQEMADASRMNGLLTQAGSVAGDDDSDAMDEHVEEREEIRVPVAPINATRPPTIDTSEQVPLSGLTGSSQHLPTFSRSNKDNTVNDNSVMEETKLNDDDADVDAAGETEDTFSSLYGAETQLLPSAKLHSSANGKEEKNLSQKPAGKETQLSPVNGSNDPLQKRVDLSNGFTNRETNGIVPVDRGARNDATETPNKHPEQEEENVSVDMKVTPQKGVLSMISYPNDHIEVNDETTNDKSTEVNNEHDEANRDSQSQDLLEVSPVSRRGDEGDKSPKPHTNMREQPQGEGKNESKWMLNRGKDRSPRFKLPALKPSPQKKGDKTNNSKPTEDSITADESDDDDSLPGQYNPHPLDNDPIEDTQTQDMHSKPKKSSLKRLSRSTPMYQSKKDDSSSESSSHMFSARASNSSSTKKQSKKTSPFKASKSIITPKVLQYPKTIDEQHDESHSELEDDEEKSFGETNQRSYHFQQSQTNYRALKQLEEVKKFTKMLPSAEELSELASRKQLLEEINKLRHSHSKEVTSLTKEVSNLRKVVKQKDEVIEEKDEIIREIEVSLQEKNDIVKTQARALDEMMSKFRAITSPVSVQKEKQSNSTDTSSDDSDGSSEVVLSALKKRPAATSKSKSKTTTTPTEANKHQHRASTKEDPETRPFSSKIWKVLQEKGWKYKTGPEPYNKVYMPPDGATHRGTTVGIHFFLADEVIEAAAARGHLSGSDGEASDALNQPAEAEKEWSDEQVDETVLAGPMDDSKLCGDSKLITLETGRQCLELSASFMREESASFMGVLFDPLWQCLKTQGKSKLNWGYEKYTSLTRNWCFVPPSSKLGAKGDNGTDFYLSEEGIVLKVLEESVKMPELAPLFSKHCAALSKLMPILARAVENDMLFQDARDNKSPKSRTRRQTSPLLSADKPEPSKKRQRSVSPKANATGEKRKTPSTSFSDKSRPSAKKKKTDPNISPAFHSSQTQRNEVSAPSFSRPSPSTSGGPLSNYEFFYSGVDKTHGLDARIKKLGGRVITVGSHTAATSHGKLFFLSEYTYWRRPKYMIAASLGVPMLHYEWLADLEKKVKEGGPAKAMSSDLYQKHRLPIGLDHSTGVYPLQRASHARDWLRPGFIRSGEGKGIFEGMTIAIAVDPQTESEWRAALSALGASVITTKSPALKAKGQLENVDCCLLSSASLPPQATSVPVHVSEMMRHIPTDVPLLDLAWAHQSIIQRKQLPLVGNPRYEVSLCENATGGYHEVYSIKRKTARYEVGDLIQFSNNSKMTCYGRILSIRWAKLGKSKLEVQLLEKTGDFELTDCPSSAKLNIEENNLDGNIVLLGSKDMRNLGYIPENPYGCNIFRQVKQMHESQM